MKTINVIMNVGLITKEYKTEMNYTFYKDQLKDVAWKQILYPYDVYQSLYQDIYFIHNENIFNVQIDIFKLDDLTVYMVTEKVRYEDVATHASMLQYSISENLHFTHGKDNDNHFECTTDDTEYAHIIKQIFPTVMAIYLETIL